MKNSGPNDSGKLYIVSTPIGNLEDITIRAMNVLKEVDLIVAENTRRTKVLLNHYNIHTKLTSYHIYNEHKKSKVLIDKLCNGENLALVSDAGTPCIADPGFLLIREALKQNIGVEIIPGVSSLTFAVCASCLPVHEFSFFGFPPVKKGAREKLFRKINDEGRTAFLFVPPHKLSIILEDIVNIMAPDSNFVLIREATKLHEEILRTHVSELPNIRNKLKSIKGEIVIGIKP